MGCRPLDRSAGSRRYLDLKRQGGINELGSVLHGFAKEIRKKHLRSKYQKYQLRPSYKQLGEAEQEASSMKCRVLQVAVILVQPCPSP